MGNRDQGDSWRLQSLTPLDVLPDYDDNPYAYYCSGSHGCTRRARRHARLLPGARRAEEGQERRPALAMGTGPGRRGRPQPAQPTAASTLAGFLLSQFGTQTIAGQESFAAQPTSARPKPPAPTPSTPSRTTKRSPGSPPASSGSSSPTSSTRSRSTRRSPTTPRRARAKTPSMPWRRSSRTAASSTGPPIT